VIQTQLTESAGNHDRLILLTHVPPFREACWYEGQISDDQWAPHFTCQAVGETIRQFMRRHPNKQLIVLCGHTHGGGCARPAPNVIVHTGAAQYGSPRVTQIIELDGDQLTFAS
jgi:Icc-related predicted phosphoesterase